MTNSTLTHATSSVKSTEDSLLRRINVASLVFMLLSLTMVISMALFSSQTAASDHHGHAEEEQPEPPKGPHNGRLLTDGEFSIELSLFERGVPPEFRIYATYQGKAIAPEQVQVNVELARLGDVTDRIRFTPEADYLRGDMTVYEPHSFQVTLTARYANKSYRWEYDNFEGRTHIATAMAQTMNIQTELAGSQQLHETVKVYGELTLPPNAARTIRARYAGTVKNLYVNYGDVVQKGQRLLSIESNESLQTYHLVAPISGVISEQLTAQGEQANDQALLVITDYSQLTAELNVYPSQQAQVRIGADVRLQVAGHNNVVAGKIADKRFVSGEAHAQQYRVFIDNSQQQFTVGQFVTAHVTVATHTATVAVRVDAIQAFRDFEVVYAKFGEDYEVRMLTIGRRSADWVEVLEGLPAGTEYVTVNSYVIKADIEKSGAAHDH